jgi:hypothetical protein
MHIHSPHVVRMTSMASNQTFLLADWGPVVVRQQDAAAVAHVAQAAQPKCTP